MTKEITDEYYDQLPKVVWYHEPEIWDNFRQLSEFGVKCRRVKWDLSEAIRLSKIDDLNSILALSEGEKILNSIKNIAQLFVVDNHHDNPELLEWLSKNVKAADELLTKDIVKYDRNNYPNPDSWSRKNIVSEAVQYGRIKITKWFAKQERCKEFFRLKNSEGLTIAMLTARTGNIEMLNELWKLNKEEKLNLDSCFWRAVDNDGQNLALHAAEKGHTEIVEWTLKLDKKLWKTADNYGKNIAIHAASGGHIETLKWIANQDKTVFTHSDKYGNTFAKYIQPGNCGDEINYLKTGIERSPVMMKFILTFSPENIFSAVKYVLVETAPITIPLLIGYTYACSNNTPESLLRRFEAGKIKSFTDPMSVTSTCPDVIAELIINLAGEIPMRQTFVKDMIYSSFVSSLPISPLLLAAKSYWKQEEAPLLGDTEQPC